MAAVSSSNPLKARLGRFFGAHGQFCASHPWEVIVSVVTLTVCFLSIGVLRGGKVGTLCGINKPCEEKGEVRKWKTHDTQRLISSPTLSSPLFSSPFPSVPPFRPQMWSSSP